MLMTLDGMVLPTYTLYSCYILTHYVLGNLHIQICMLLLQVRKGRLPPTALGTAIASLGIVVCMQLLIALVSLQHNANVLIHSHTSYPHTQARRRPNLAPEILKLLMTIPRIALPVKAAHARRVKAMRRYSIIFLMFRWRHILLCCDYGDYASHADI